MNTAMTYAHSHEAVTTYTAFLESDESSTSTHIASDLKPHAMSISHFLTKHPIPIKDISKDKPWPQVVINGVDTGISTWDDNPSTHLMSHILNTLHADNPWLANIKLKKNPDGYVDPTKLATKNTLPWS
jgi:hypothetical protein